MVSKAVISSKTAPLRHWALRPHRALGDSYGDIACCPATSAALQSAWHAIWGARRRLPPRMRLRRRRTLSRRCEWVERSNGWSDRSDQAPQRCARARGHARQSWGAERRLCERPPGLAQPCARGFATACVADGESEAGSRPLARRQRHSPISDVRAHVHARAVRAPCSHRARAASHCVPAAARRCRPSPRRGWRVSRASNAVSDRSTAGQGPRRRRMERGDERHVHRALH